MARHAFRFAWYISLIHLPYTSGIYELKPSSLNNLRTDWGTEFLLRSYKVSGLSWWIYYGVKSVKSHLQNVENLFPVLELRNKIDRTLVLCFCRSSFESPREHVENLPEIYIRVTYMIFEPDPRLKRTLEFVNTTKRTNFISLDQLNNQEKLKSV